MSWFPLRGKVRHRLFVMTATLGLAASAAVVAASPATAATYSFTIKNSTSYTMSRVWLEAGKFNPAPAVNVNAGGSTGASISGSSSQQNSGGVKYALTGNFSGYELWITAQPWHTAYEDLACTVRRDGEIITDVLRLPWCSISNNGAGNVLYVWNPQGTPYKRVTITTNVNTYFGDVEYLDEGGEFEPAFNPYTFFYNNSPIGFSPVGDNWVEYLAYWEKPWRDGVFLVRVLNNVTSCSVSGSRSSGLYCTVSADGNHVSFMR